MTHPIIELRVIGWCGEDGTVRITAGVQGSLALAGIDMPALQVPAQRKAAEVVFGLMCKWLADAADEEAELWLRDHELAHDVIRADTGESLSRYLVGLGVAVKTDGSRRHKWTDEELFRIESLAIEPEEKPEAG